MIFKELAEVGPQPIGEATFKELMGFLIGEIKYIKIDLDRFENAAKEVDNLKAIERAKLCVKNFVMMMGKIEEETNHPADIDRLFEDKKFSEEFVRTLEDFQRINPIDYLNLAVQSDDIDFRIVGDREDFDDLLETASNFLIRANIYKALGKK